MRLASSFAKLLLPLCVFPLLLGMNWVTPAESKLLAFVVGIDDYDNLGADQKKLTRAVRDAVDVAKSLEGLGFEVVSGVGKNLKRDEFNDKWRGFAQEIKPGRNDTVVIFISGHGMEIEGNNYILARNAPFKRAGRQGELDRESISLKELVLDLQARRPRLGLILLDACRTNPFIPTEFTSTHGLGGTSITGDGLLIVYSASGNETALDRLPSVPPDPDPNSVFTRALLPLLQTLKTSETPLYLAWSQILQQKVRRIAKTANYKQSPKVYSGLEGEFCLLGECKNRVIKTFSATQASPGSTGCEIWPRLKDSTNEQDLLNFVVEFRGSECAKLATLRLAALTRHKSSLHIISVGTNIIFSDPAMNLRFAAADAQDMSNALRRYMGPSYERSHVYELINEGATKRAIQDSFNKMREAVKPNDSVIVYLSGYVHVVKGRPYLIPADGTLDDPSSLVDLLELQQILAGTFGNRILLIDTCGVRLEGPLKTAFFDDPRDYQITVLAGTLPHEVSYEDVAAGHGIFTSAILNALSKAPIEYPLGLTIDDLFAYVSHNTHLRSQTLGIVQTPYLITDNGQFVLIPPPVSSKSAR